MRSQRGITLIELLTVMVIVGILAAITVPAYRNYALKAKRADAKVELTSFAQKLEQCYTRYNLYTATGATQCNLTVQHNAPLGAASTAATYAIDQDTSSTLCPAGIGAQCFALKATPVNGQARDSHCGTLTLDSAGSRGAAASDCW